APVLSKTAPLLVLTLSKRTHAMTSLMNARQPSVRRPLAIKLRFAAVSLFLVLAVPTAFYQNSQTQVDQRTDRPLNMLVLGDSILWGQGLKTEHKSWYHVKVWLENTI